MSAYLDRLKQLVSGNNFQNTPSIKPAKPPKAPFDGFGGKHPGTIENILVTSATALPEHEMELKRLVRLVSEHHGFNQDDYEEALEVALGDSVNALTCFTALARKIDLI